MTTNLIGRLLTIDKDTDEYEIMAVAYDSMSEHLTFAMLVRHTVTGCLKTIYESTHDIKVLDIPGIGEIGR